MEAAGQAWLMDIGYRFKERRINDPLFRLFLIMVHVRRGYNNEQ